MTRQEKIKQQNEWLKCFHECHESGSKEFGSLWLAANGHAVNLASQFGMDASSTQVKAFMSRIIMCALRTAAKREGSR